MESVSGMTPDQLRAMADAMDAEGGLPGYMRVVEVDGVTVEVDMRVVGDIRTLRLVAAVDKGGPDAVQHIMRLFDRLFGEQQDRIIDALSDEDGFCPVQRFTEFCVHLLNEVGAKN